jgi:hypothetical protein
MAPAPAADIRVIDVPDRSRFEIRVDGEVAGFTEYRHGPGLIAFIHTLTDPRFEGGALLPTWFATGDTALIPSDGSKPRTTPPRRDAGRVPLVFLDWPTHRAAKREKPWK